MKGDFSRFRFNPEENDTGVLYQQGRVFVDTDGSSATLIASHLRRKLAAHTIGIDVAAVPASEPDSFKITQATASASDVLVTLTAGRLWADGVPLVLAPARDLTFEATYLEAPFQAPTPSAREIAAGIRDAAILEVWEEAFNAFQDPLQLIEPALGGVDTTERVRASFALRLLRLNAGEDCTNIAGRLADNFPAKGHLTVTPAASMTISGDCPVDVGGGYSGFEHYLYRIEVAEPDANGSPRFKWSQFNGGLVGRGSFASTGATTGTVTVKANGQAINHCGLPGFFLEALAYDALLGHWRVVFSADAALPQDDTLSLSNISGNWPATAPATAFFRLWNGVALVGAFPVPSAGAQALPLQDGIQLAFDAPASGAYTPGDYWTFPVRASGAGVDAAWIAANWPNNLPPTGVRYRRVPLGVLDWTGPPQVTITADAGQIEDCRRVFDPLTDLRGCCIEVRPGDDVQRALKKVLDAGGGCLCLLPGDHLLKQPIDLTRRNSVQIRGFGPASRLLIPRRFAAAPFILLGAHDITLESFLVINASPLPLMACGSTVRLRVKSVFAITTLDEKEQPVIALQGSCYGWSLTDNVFVGSVGLAGRLLASSSILDNVWIGTRRAIYLDYAQELQIERNDFLGMRVDLAKELDATLGGIVSSGTKLSSSYALTYSILNAANAANAPAYLAVELHGAFDVDVIDNEFYGAYGLYLEWLENCLVERNRFRTLVAGAACGIAHGLRFLGNRVGVAADEKSQQPVVCDTGLVLRADVIECRIADNVFANVRQGVVFQPDFGSAKAITSDFSANLYTLAAVTPEVAKAQLDDAMARAKEIVDRNLLINSTFFRVARSERVIIEGNQFHAAGTGIEWSGTTQIVDFRIAGNSFIGCQDVAIQIEPEARILMLADPVDTKVRLIDNNRFDVLSGAVRATLGAVRMERNDIRINAPIVRLTPPRDILTAVAGNVYNSQVLAQANQSNDTPLMLLGSMKAMATVESNPGTVNAPGLSKVLDSGILQTYPALKGDIMADRMLAVKTLADLSAKPFVASLANVLLPKLTFNNEGFAINLAGTQNVVLHNRLYGSNPSRPGGVLFNAVSGTVRDNEIAVQGTALMLSGKTGLGSGLQGVEVIGNSLASTGVAGDKTGVYALAIPSLSPGNLAINNNVFKGSVMIGGDPISAQGFSKPTVFQFPAMFTNYNVMKFDAASYAKATLVKTFAQKLATVVVMIPPGVFQLWQSDPHANRPIVHFCQNRVIQGWVGVFQSLSGAYWSTALLKSQANQALIANIAHNVLDYGGSAVGYDAMMIGNYSQAALKYRVGNTVQAVANIPAAVSF